MSKGFRRAAQVCIYQVRRQLFSSRAGFLLLLFAAYFYLNEEGIRNFCRDVQVNAVPLAFPFLTNDWICQMILAGGFLWLVMPLGSQEAETDYMKFRAGDNSWNFGNCLAVFASAVVYTGILIVISNVVLFPYLGLETGWGRIWRTLAFTDASWKYGVQLVIDKLIIKEFTPVGAVALSFCLEVLCLTWLGSLMYVVNSRTGTVAGFMVL